ncbi:ribosomal protein S18-alanine N-acetyltransferase [Agromyces seonyuensis]|uniref:Ribosomal protein S18-alanine N-acetyltransferase n=1 Tax=Agromyces seonyuensis TaxID=2662446 RepID=A0A6I4P867_9MICO|nr:ribosomal protein S18-alanine N-acetyltransferase [Agromyces seonyuensis]MWC00098.1 ribosomal protein S18-alanine N-acetyltransferase [Agromyces seonyuensis]
MSGPVPRFRAAGADDLDAIMAIESAVFEDDAWSSANMRAELVNPSTYYLVVVDDAAPAESRETALLGYAGLLSGVGAPQADIQTIAVVPEARGLGLGRALMQQLVAVARRRGAEEVFLEVRADNHVAQSLYRSLGFEELGVRRGYYRGGIDALTMRLTVPAPEARPARASSIGPVGSETQQ